MFSSWYQVLAELRKHRGSSCSFMITTNKGTENEKRSRFLTYSEAMILVMDELGKI